MTVITPDQLTNIRLDKGSHHSPTEGMCLMEAVAFVRGIEFSDRPPCVSPILGTYGRSLNDVLPDDKRQQLIRYIPDLPGTADDGKDEARGYLALDWLIRVYTPTWLRLVPALTAQADLLAQHAPIRTLEDAAGAVREAASQAAAAWAAAWDAAGAAAGDAARAAAGAATVAAAWAAAGDAAGDAARAAACDAAGAAAGAAAGDAACDAAWAAAGAAAWDAAGAAAGDAAGDAAGAALNPTVATLQDSAIDLFGVMIRGGETE